MAEMRSIEHEQLLDEYVDLWNGDRSKLDVVAESVAVYDPGHPAGEVHGRDAFGAYLDEIRAGFPDFQVTLGEVMERDGVVFGEWTVTATHEGPFNGMPPTGREMELSGMDKVVVSDGEVREHYIYYDVQSMVEQLGVAEG